MRKFKIRIGVKVGSSALVGLILVAGTVWNQARVSRLTQDLIGQAALSRNLQQAALEAKVRLNELISIDRDLRLAKTSSDVNAVLQHLKSRAADANSAYDSAIAIAGQDEDRQFLAKAQAAFNSYIVAAEEIAGHHASGAEGRDPALHGPHRPHAAAAALGARLSPVSLQLLPRESGSVHRGQFP